jgi:hypothetical protein
MALHHVVMLCGNAVVNAEMRLLLHLIIFGLAIQKAVGAINATVLLKPVLHMV